jgi:hypothetical protein
VKGVELPPTHPPRLVALRDAEEFEGEGCEEIENRL